MSTIGQSAEKDGNALEALKLGLLQKLAGGKSRLELDFKEAYPLFEEHLARKMRKRILMDQFNLAYTHELNLAQFRKLLGAERDRRSQSGEVVACSCCGKLLRSTAEVDGTESE